MTSFRQAYCRRAVIGPLFFVSLVSVSISGCGRKAPFDLGRVSGSISFSDGSLIKADRIELLFVPVGPAPTGGPAPRVARAEVDPSTGKFSGATSYEMNDGAVVGPVKIAIVAWVLPKAGAPQLSQDIPKQFTSGATSTLAAEIHSGANKLNLKIPK